MVRTTFRFVSGSQPSLGGRFEAWIQPVEATHALNLSAGLMSAFAYWRTWVYSYQKPIREIIVNRVPPLTRSCLMTVFAFLAASVSNASLGAVLLEIDVTDPTAVVLTATNNNSAIDNSDYDEHDGSCLLEFFTADAPGSDLEFSSSTLKPISTAFAYDYLWIAASSEGGLRSACPYSYDGDETQVFSTSSRAFEGSATMDLTGFPLPAPGASGNIVSGYLDADVSAPLGEWLVISNDVGTPLSERSATAVPTLSAYGLVVTALGLLLVARRGLRVSTKRR